MKNTSPNASRFAKHLCCVLSVTIGAIEASSDFNHHHDTSQYSSFLYNEIQSVDFDIVYEDGDDSSSLPTDETRHNPLDNGQSQYEQQSPYESAIPSFDFSVSDYDNDYYDAPVTVVESSLLYDGDCYVSSEAMMCHGGGADTGMDRFIDYDELLEFFDEDVTDEDDDEDDDDNDGHSSMLSNASLRRSKSTRKVKTRCYASDNAGGKTKPEHTAYLNKAVSLSNVQKLQIRLEEEGRKQQQSKTAFVRGRTAFRR
jgi:hypothetical protein